MLIKPTYAHPLRKWFFAPAVAIALLLALLIPATPAPAASRATYYLSLGDSLAEGIQPVGSTHHGYADQLYKLERQQPQYSRLRLQKVGCGGESTASILHPSYCRYRNSEQLAEAVAFLDTHRGRRCRSSRSRSAPTTSVTAPVTSDPRSVRSRRTCR